MKRFWQGPERGTFFILVHMAKQPALTYAKAYDTILHNQNLTTNERIVLIVVCRFWPEPCTMSNGSIAYDTGLSTRTVQYTLKSLSTGPTKRIGQSKTTRRAYIIREYQHITHHHITYTIRSIFPIFLPGPRKRTRKRPPQPQDRGGPAKPIGSFL